MVYSRPYTGVVIPLSIWGNWGSERGCDLSQVTQQQGSGGRIRSPTAIPVSERESPQTLSGPILPEDWVSGTVTSSLGLGFCTSQTEIVMGRRPGKQWVACGGVLSHRDSGLQALGSSPAIPTYSQQDFRQSLDLPLCALVSYMKNGGGEAGGRGEEPISHRIVVGIK